MRPLLPALALLVLPVAPAFSEDAKPTVESVRHLFEIMQTSQMIDTVMSQMDANLRGALERATGGRPLNAQQQQLHDDMRAKVLGMLKDELTWSRLEPQMVEVYRSTFSRGEVDAMLKFYGSSSGQAIVAKLPQASQQMMQLTQERVRALVPRIVELQKETAQRIKDAAEPPPAPPSPQPPSPAPH